MPRHDELRTAHDAGGRVRDHGPRARPRHQLLRHCQPLRRAERSRHDRDHHRQLVRAGRRPPREGRARHEGLRPDERVAERRWTLCPPHHRRVRGESPAPPDRPHRPLPDAPRRPERAVGRGVAGDGAPVRAGQDHLRRKQQLRGLAHRAGQRGREQAQLPRSRQRAEPLQPRVAHGRARSAAGVPSLRPRCDPVEPARGRHAGRDEGGRHRAPQEPEPALGRDAAAAREVGEALRGARRGACRGRVGLAAATP